MDLDWFECSGCFTACCTTCLTEYLQRATGESKSLCCPQPECESNIPEHVSLLLVGAERLAMHQKHLDMKGDPDLRECPHCGVLNKGSADAPDMTCTACSNSFCFHHDLQHAGKKCSKLRSSGSSVLSQLYLSCRTTKCPGCSAPVQRNKGCAHMVCAKCNTDFCYYCGKATPPGTGSIGTHRRLWSMQCHAPRQWAKRTGTVVAVPVAAGLATAAAGLALAVAPVAGPAYLVQRRAKQRRRREARERLWGQRM